MTEASGRDFVRQTVRPQWICGAQEGEGEQEFEKAGVETKEIEEAEVEVSDEVSTEGRDGPGVRPAKGQAHARPQAPQ